LISDLNSTTGPVKARVEPFKNDLSFRAPSFDQSVRPPEAPSVYRAEILGDRALQNTFVDQFRNLVQQRALLSHVGRFKGRSREHEFPMYRNALAFEYADIERGRIVNQTKSSLRSDQFCNLCEMTIGIRCRKHEARRSNAKSLHLRRKRFAVINDMMRAEPLNPVSRLGP
jgi:hypothetical protein